MAQLVSETLLRRHATSTATTLSGFSKTTSSRFVTHRHLSKLRGKGKLIEIELESLSDGAVEVTNSGVQKLEDLIHRIIVLRSRPAWLPFVPGSSYWVPPIKKPTNFAHLLDKLANPLTEDETMSLSTNRGWPSSTFFIHGGAFTAPVMGNMDDSSADSTVVHVHVQESLENDSSNESDSDE